jgi:hypothetical protein
MECDDHVVVIRADVVEVNVAVAHTPAPFDPGPENLPGLLGPVSGRARAPEAPALASTPPFHVRVHEAHERLDVARREGFICLADALHRLDRSLPPL